MVVTARVPKQRDSSAVACCGVSAAHGHGTLQHVLLLQWAGKHGSMCAGRSLVGPAVQQRAMQQRLVEQGWKPLQAEADVAAECAAQLHASRRWQPAAQQLQVLQYLSGWMTVHRVGNLCPSVS